jgi:hypothetical protein
MSKNRLLAGFVILSLLAWLAVIVSSGFGWAPLGPSNFENPGAFGDSFGPLGAVMAACAAWVALQTLKEQRQELSRLSLREEEQDAKTTKNEFERTFFQLLQAWREIQKSVDVDIGSVRKNGQDAFRSIVLYYSRLTDSGEVAWRRTYEKYRNDLGHYFRFLYHIVSFVDGADGVDRYFYVRLLRASLSDAELLLLALNCAYGEGRHKFKKTVEAYSLLHNLSDTYRRKYIRDDMFLPVAFERDPDDA